MQQTLTYTWWMRWIGLGWRACFRGCTADPRRSTYATGTRKKQQARVKTALFTTLHALLSTLLLCDSRKHGGQAQTRRERGGAGGCGCRHPVGAR